MFTDNSAERNLHYVAFDIPIPVNYGGAIDIYYKIRSLAEAGIRIHLHCFQYGRDPAPELNDYCATVYYYPRRFSAFHLFHRSPYIVRSRSSRTLLQRLACDPYPILFEGLHSCVYLDHPTLADRHKIVRTHNIEHDYYGSLADVEKNPWKKLYFRKEAWKLRHYENILGEAQGIAAISKKDQEHFLEVFPGQRTEVVSAFHPFTEVTYREGMGDFALYHGSLEVGENNKAALFLIDEVFSHIPVRFVIAGNKPSVELLEKASRYDRVEVRKDLSTPQIYDLVAKAQVNILPTFQATGIKLKLLSALFTGRHCIVNHQMIENTGLESLCQVCDSPEQMREAVMNLMRRPFKREESQRRNQVLQQGGFFNRDAAVRMIRMLFPD